MQCVQCGKEIGEGMKICEECASGEDFYDIVNKDGYLMPERLRSGEIVFIGDRKLLKKYLVHSTADIFFEAVQKSWENKRFSEIPSSTIERIAGLAVSRQDLSEKSMTYGGSRPDNVLSILLEEVSVDFFYYLQAFLDKKEDGSKKSVELRGLEFDFIGLIDIYVENNPASGTVTFLKRYKDTYVFVDGDEGKNLVRKDQIAAPIDLRWNKHKIELSPVIYIRRDVYHILIQNNQLAMIERIIEHEYKEIQKTESDPSPHDNPEEQQRIAEVIEFLENHGYVMAD